MELILKRVVEVLDARDSMPNIGPFFLNTFPFQPIVSLLPILLPVSKILIKLSYWLSCGVKYQLRPPIVAFADRNIGHTLPTITFHGSSTKPTPRQQ